MNHECLIDRAHSGQTCRTGGEAAEGRQGHPLEGSGQEAKTFP